MKGVQERTEPIGFKKLCLAVKRGVSDSSTSSSIVKKMSRETMRPQARRAIELKKAAPTSVKTA